MLNIAIPADVHRNLQSITDARKSFSGSVTHDKILSSPQSWLDRRAMTARKTSLRPTTDERHRWKEHWRTLQRLLFPVCYGPAQSARYVSLFRYAFATMRGSRLPS